MNLSVFESPQLWIAVLALILSQLPPLRDLLRGTKIRLNTKEQFTLDTFLGRLEVIIFLDIHNTGGKAVSISKIYCVIQRDKEHVWNLPARTYLTNEGEILIGGIPLKPGEHWSQSVRCYDLWEEEEEEEVTNIISRFRTWRGPEDSPLPTSEANADLVSEAKHFLRLTLTCGGGITNYSLLLYQNQIKYSV